MMTQMLDQFTSDRPKDPAGHFSRCRVLELGAGTGIFTRRLVERPDIECTAVEIDTVCFSRLTYNLRHHDSVDLRMTDSRTFGLDGASERFTYIFSSFSDHHIRPKDRGQYYRAIKHNLVPGGKLIVGDEFLPEYDTSEPAARGAALKAYHGHIIEEALRRAEELSAHGNEKLAMEHRELAKLEQAALKSGLEGIGDFKVSRREYEKTLQDHGFSFTAKKIGPLDKDGLGGVYVYVAWL
jgi:SAM-dependent methyltransferase